MNPRHSSGKVLALSAWLTTLSLCAPLLAAPSIFDDDWRPPTRTEAPPVLPAQPKVEPAPKPAATPPADPPALPPIADPLPVVTAGRKPIPPRADQQKSRKLMREVYAKQIADTSPAGRKDFARVLITEADKVADAPTDQYVLLAGAMESAADGGSILFAVDAVDRMAKTFDIDPLATKTQAVSRMRPATEPLSADSTQAGLDLIGQLVTVEDYESATRICSILQAGKFSSPKLRDAVQYRAKELATLKASRERLMQAAERLKVTPNDPAACLVVGSYLCFEKADWDNGLPLLALVESPFIRSAASADRIGPANAAGQVAVGDAWWEAAEKETSPSSLANQMRRRAVAWYKLALASGQMKGLERVRLDKRVEELDRRLAEAARASDALKAIGKEPARVEPWLPAAGKWTRRWTVKGADTKPDLRVQTYTVFQNGSRVKAFTWDLPFLREPDGSLSIEGQHFFQTFTKTNRTIEVREWKNRADYTNRKEPIYIGTFVGSPGTELEFAL